MKQFLYIIMFFSIIGCSSINEKKELYNRSDEVALLTDSLRNLSIIRIGMNFDSESKFHAFYGLVGNLAIRFNSNPNLYVSKWNLETICNIRGFVGSLKNDLKNNPSIVALNVNSRSYERPLQDFLDDLKSASCLQ